MIVLFNRKKVIKYLPSKDGDRKTMKMGKVLCRKTTILSFRTKLTSILIMMTKFSRNVSVSINLSCSAKRISGFKGTPKRESLWDLDVPVERFLEDDCNGTSRVSFSYLDLFKYQQNDRSTRGRCSRPLKSNNNCGHDAFFRFSHTFVFVIFKIPWFNRSPENGFSVIH